MKVKQKPTKGRLEHVPGPPKRSHQGQGRHSVATPGRRKLSRGQGR
jgi:hypothetical protein